MADDGAGAHRGLTRAPWAGVPAEAGALLRPGLPDVVDAIVARVRAEVPEYDQPLEGEFGRLIGQGVSVALDEFVALLGTDDEPDLAVPEGLGRAELQAGRTLDALQSAYRVGARVAWRETVRAAEGRLEPPVLYALAEAIFAYIDRLADASVSGYAQEQSLRAGVTQARRQALVEALAGEADPAAVRRAAERAGWSLPARVAALATDAESDPAALARRMPPDAVGATLDRGAVLLIPDAGGPGRLAAVRRGLGSRRAALGPVVGWGEAHVTIDRALAAFELGEDGLVVADERLLDLLLATDGRLTADLARRALAPLDGLPPGARARALETLRAWLDAHGDVSVAADVLHVHPQTVRYRLAGLRERFGDALDDPRRRLEIELSLAASSG